MTRSLKIAIVASASYPIREPFAGGLEAHTHGMALGLRRRGHDVTVFAAEDSDDRIGYEPVCPPARRLKLSRQARIDPSMPSDRFMTEHHAYQALMLRLAKSKFDVVHNNSLHYLPVAMSDTLPMPVLTTLHTPPTPWLESAFRSGPPSRRMRCAAVSRRTARQWQGLVESEVIPNGIDLGRWAFRAGPRIRRVVWTGRLVPEKGPHHAIDAARAASIPIVLAGPIGDRDYFREEIRPRLSSSARYVGHADSAGLADFVGRSAVALVTPCWEEPFGLVIAEALACGTPVAAWDRGAVSEVLEDDCGRVAPAGDVRALAGAIAEATKLDPLRCRRSAEARFGQAAMLDRYERAFETAVAGSPP